MTIKLGTICKDILTGFKGVVMGRAEYFTGCNQILLTPQSLTKEGKRPDGEWFDESRIEVVKDKPIKLNEPLRQANPGADERPAPTK